MSMSMRIFEDRDNDKLIVETCDPEDIAIEVKQAWGRDSGDEQDATVVFDKATAEQVRDYLIELLPLNTAEAPQPQLEQVGNIIVDSRPLPVTINVTGNVYINQIEKGE